MDDFRLYLGDCLDVMRTLPDNSIDSVVTDPPYELGFMGKTWDSTGIANSPQMWREVLRVLKPGGHLLAFSGSRTYHRMVCAIEDSGFEIRDQIMWLYGSGFPKSLDVSKAIDKAAGAEREVVGFDPAAARRSAAIDTAAYGDYRGQTGEITAPSTEEAKYWDGWGTALKPAHEPICVARKPLIGTVAANVLEFGTGAINIGGCRVGDEVRQAAYTSFGPCSGNSLGKPGTQEARRGTQGDAKNYVGRWPANLIHDGLETEWARFFYCAKASQKDRDEGLDAFEKVRTGAMLATADGSMLTGSGNERVTVRANTHPTVKPTDLMCYLVRLVAPPGGVVLDPFMGSGSTGKACALEGFRFVGIDMSPEYLEIAGARIGAALLKDLLS